jgi:hypothetical protein
MNLLTKLRHALLGRPQPRVTKLDGPETAALRIDELPPFNLNIAELMRYDPQVRIGLGARNGLLMAAEVEVTGDDARLVRWVQHQWDALWHAAAHRLLKTKLYGFLPFEVVYRQATNGEFRGLIEVERLIDHQPRYARLLVEGDKIVGFSYEQNSVGTALRGGPATRGRHLPEHSYADTRNATEGVPYSETENLFAPQALVCTFDAECGNPYGCALLARAYPAWFEK